MTLTILLVWALVGLGLIYLITAASITARVRIRFAKNSSWRAELIYCPACTGFWVGLLLGIEGLWPEASQGIHETAMQSALAMMAVGALWGRYGPEGPFTDEMEDVFPELSELGTMND